MIHSTQADISDVLKSNIVISSLNSYAIFIYLINIKIFKLSEISSY